MQGFEEFWVRPTRSLGLAEAPPQGGGHERTKYIVVQKGAKKVAVAALPFCPMGEMVPRVPSLHLSMRQFVQEGDEKGLGCEIAVD